MQEMADLDMARQLKLIDEFSLLEDYGDVLLITILVRGLSLDNSVRFGI